MKLFPLQSEKGFTLLELVVVMGVFMFVLIISSSAFENVIRLSSSTTKSVQSQTEGVVGLEMLRKDLNSAGFALPWAFQTNPPSASSYLEADLGANNPITGINGADFNDAPPNTGTATPAPAIPRAVQLASVPAAQLPILGSGGAVNSNPGSDYLVIKSASVGYASAVGKWGYVNYSGNQTGNLSYIPKWNSLTVNADFQDGDVLVTHTSTFSGLSKVQHMLAMRDAQHFSYALLNNSSTSAGFSSVDAAGHYVPEQTPFENYKPTGSLLDPLGNKIDNEKLVVYGIQHFPKGSNETIRMPFNRADYFVKRPAIPPASQDTDQMPLPARCNPGTGKLYKAVVNNWVTAANAGKQTLYPLLDCVGDMQVVFDLKDANDPTKTVPSDTLAALSADDIRDRLKALHVYLLVHEGGLDRKYSYPYSDPKKVIILSDSDWSSLGRTFDVATMLAFFGPDWVHYRWKVVTIVGQPYNLMY